MVGIEYNWLVSTSPAVDGSLQIRLSGGGMLTVLVAVFCVLAVVLRAQPAPLEHALAPTSPSSAQALGQR